MKENLCGVPGNVTRTTAVPALCRLWGGKNYLPEEEFQIRKT